LRGSFVPPAPIRELRDLTRYRAALIGERGRCAGSSRRCARPWPGTSVSITPFSQVLAHLDYLDEVIETVSTHIEAVMAPLAEEVNRLDTIPGVNQRPAEVLIAEIGVDMSVFPTAGQLASWAGLCSGNNESPGKHKSGRTRKGNRWLRSALIQAALATGTRSTKPEAMLLGR
jgi:transposase